MLSMLGKDFSRQHFQTFSNFLEKKRLDISCNLFQNEKICRKCQSIFFGKNKKNIAKLWSTDFAHSKLSVKEEYLVIILVYFSPVLH